MKLLVTGDWHGDVVTMGVPRFPEVHDAAHKTAQAAIDEGCDVFGMLGDLTDPDSGASSYQSTALALECAVHLMQHQIHSIWIAGNHDVFEDASGTTTLTPLRELEKLGYVHVAESMRVVKIRDTHFFCFPFVAAMRGSKTVNEDVAKLWPKKSSRVVVLGHATHIPGAILGSETTDMPRGRSVPFPVEATTSALARFNGHFHHRQKSPDGIIMPGSLARLRFDEERHNPGYVLAEV